MKRALFYSFPAFWLPVKTIFSLTEPAGDTEKIKGDVYVFKKIIKTLLAL